MNEVQVKSVYESWQKFCKQSDKECDEYNKLQEKCPLCDNSLVARWNYDGDYYPYFKIECSNCSFNVNGPSLENCLNDLHWKENHNLK